MEYNKENKRTTILVIILMAFASLFWWLRKNKKTQTTKKNTTQTDPTGRVGGGAVTTIVGNDLGQYAIDQSKTYELVFVESRNTNHCKLSLNKGGENWILTDEIGNTLASNRYWLNGISDGGALNEPLVPNTLYQLLKVSVQQANDDFRGAMLNWQNVQNQTSQIYFYIKAV